MDPPRRMLGLMPRAKSASPPREKPATSRACSLCGRTRPCAPGGLPMGWTMQMNGKRLEYLCVDCARANIRAIEGKLPEEYWE